MNIEELFPDAILEDTETEFKGILSKGKDKKGDNLEIEWLKTLAAFANGNGGRMFVGVENKSHKIVALDSNTADKQILLVNQEIRNRFDPVIYPEIRKHIIDEKEHNILIEIIVKHSPLLPVFVKDRGTYFTFIRRFGETDIATSLEVRQLIMASEDISFDSTITEESFDKNEFKSLFSAYSKNRGEDLSENTLILKGFMDKDKKLSKGALLFKDKTDNSLTAMTIVRYPGFDKGSNELEFVGRYSGPIHEMITLAKDTIINLTGKGILKTVSGEKVLLSYPERSILEGVANAYAHRNYWINGSQIQISIFQDRLEVSSPGSLLDTPFLKREKNLADIRPRHRNKVIADILMLLGLVQGLGTGFSKIENDYASADELHKPFADSDSTSFTLTLPNLNYKKGVLEHDDIIPDIITEVRALTKNEEQILAYCYYSRRTVKDIANYLNIKVSTYLSTQVLGKLVSDELLIQIGNNPKTFMTNRNNVVIA